MTFTNTINTNDQNTASNLPIDLRKTINVNITQCLKASMLQFLQCFLVLIFIIVVFIMILTSSILLALLISYSDMSTVLLIFTCLTGSLLIVCGFICFFCCLFVSVVYFTKLKNNIDEDYKQLNNYKVIEELDIFCELDKKV